MVTCDSRWSKPVDDLVFYVDDTGFDKIADRQAAVMVCAGSAVLIELWKRWFANPVGEPPLTEYIEPSGHFQAIFVSIIGKPDFRMLFSAGVFENYEDAAEFCGTGAIFAKDCYSVNGCATTAVGTAAVHDPMTGGEVKFVDVTASHRNNLSPNPASLADAAKLLETRGMVMDKKTGNVYSIADASPTIKQKLQAAATYGLSAPTGQTLRAWSAREKEDVKKVMAQIVLAEKQSGS